MSPNTRRELACREMVELVTDYLEGELDAVHRERFEAHLSKCHGCTTYLKQMRQTLAALGRIPEESLSAPARTELLRLFDEYRRG